MKQVVIIGASVAGHTLALALREANKECAITLLTEENVPCYDKRKLADFLSATAQEKEIFLARDDHYLARQIVFIKDCKVSSVNTQKCLVYGKDREPIKYDFLAICSGRRFVAPAIPGAKKTGVFCLSSLSDGKDFKTYVFGESVCVLGSNRWAREAATRLAVGHKEIKLIQPQPAAAGAGENPLCAHLEIITDQLVEIIGESQVQAVKLKGGKIIGASSVLCMEDLKSNIDFLKNSDITICDDLICVNDRMQTNRENVFASGSVCNGSAQENGLKTWEEASRESSLLARQLLIALQGL